MLFKLFLGFTIIPVIEIYFLIKVGSIFGALTTVFIVIFTGILGAYLARMQGLKTMFKVRDSLSQGIMPAEELIDALLIVIAGVVLLTPGFLTDIFGILLLIPITRSLFKKWLLGRFENIYVQGRNVTETPKNIN
ncbi:MAG: FxsA family protein [SAR324 cluster bacterium]|nr:FxsA family protein [SAR324 cluster bacterium]